MQPKLIFYWKICGNFFQGPPYKGQIFFASGRPNKCLWTVPINFEVCHIFYAVISPLILMKIDLLNYSKHALIPKLNPL